VNCEGFVRKSFNLPPAGAFDDDGDDENEEEMENGEQLKEQQSSASVSIKP